MKRQCCVDSSRWSFSFSLLWMFVGSDCRRPTRRTGDQRRRLNLRLSDVQQMDRGVRERRSGHAFDLSFKRLGRGHPRYYDGNRRLCRHRWAAEQDADAGFQHASQLRSAPFSDGDWRRCSNLQLAGHHSRRLTSRRKRSPASFWDDYEMERPEIAEPNPDYRFA